MTELTAWHRPTLWRVVVFTLIIVTGAQFLLLWISYPDDGFANTIAIASGIATLALMATYFRFVGYLDLAFLLTFAVWVASLIDLATEPDFAHVNQVRQCLFYGAFALLALGAYVARRIQNRSVN